MATKKHIEKTKWLNNMTKELEGLEEGRKGSRGTAELLYIDQHILNESNTRRKNLAMALIDYKNANDMVPQSLIINCLKMYKISDKFINFIEKPWKAGEWNWQQDEEA